MQTVAYGIRPDDGAWIVVEQIGRAQRALRAFPSLVEALAFVGARQALQTHAGVAAKSLPRAAYAFRRTLTALMSAGMSRAIWARAAAVGAFDALFGQIIKPSIVRVRVLIGERDALGMTGLLEGVVRADAQFAPSRRQPS